MQELFTAQKRESSVEVVLNRVKSLLLSGDLKPGDCLPSENELAAGLAVSRGTIREAMKILSALGVVEVRRGDGTYVSRSMGHSLFDPFLFNLIMSDADTDQLVELRELLELNLVRLIIRHGDGQALNELSAVCDEMTELAGQGEEAAARRMLAADLRFHRLLGRATGNVLVEKLYGFVMELFTPYIEKTYDGTQNRADTAKLHGDIAAALTARNEAAALAATRRSIDVWSSKLRRGQGEGA